MQLLGLGKPGHEYKSPNSLGINMTMLQRLPEVAEVFPRRINFPPACKVQGFPLCTPSDPPIPHCQFFHSGFLSKAPTSKEKKSKQRNFSKTNASGDKDGKHYPKEQRRSTTTHSCASGISQRGPASLQTPSHPSPPRTTRVSNCSLYPKANKVPPSTVCPKAHGAALFGQFKPCSSFPNINLLQKITSHCHPNLIPCRDAC